MAPEAAVQVNAQELIANCNAVHIRFYPNCASEARDCGFAHPFCGRECKCSMTERDPQKNHRPKKIAKK